MHSIFNYFNLRLNQPSTMRHLLLIITITLTCKHSLTQTSRTYNGPIESSRPHGVAKYNYYEDPVTYKRIISGNYSYTYAGQDNEPGIYLTITGNYTNGLKDGNWTYAIKMTDYEYGSEYLTGSININGAYKNGYAHGAWKEVRSIKTRTKRRSYGKEFWDPYTTNKTLTINANFNNGTLNGSISINDEFSNFKLSGKLTSDGYADGTWIIRDYAWGQYKDLIYKEGILYETVFREQDEQASSVSRYHESYDKFVRTRGLSANEREDQGVVIDTLCTEKCAAASYLTPYYTKLFTTDYFPFHALDGDLTFSQGIKGCCEFYITEQRKQSLVNQDAYIKGMAYKTEEKWLDAYEQFISIDHKTLTSSERNTLNTELDQLNVIVNQTIESLLTQHASGIKTLNEIDSTSQSAFNTLTKQFKIKTITAYNPSTYQTEVKLPSPISTYNTCKEPWNERPLEEGIRCIQLNPTFFEPYHILVLNAYKTLQSNIEELKQQLNKTKRYFNWNNQSFTLFTYDMVDFQSQKAALLQPFERANNIAHEGLLCEELTRQVSDNYIQEKKKTLLKKYNLVAQEFLQAYQNAENTEEYLHRIKTFNTFQRAYLTAYKTDTKELEKKIKDLESIEDIKRAIETHH